MLRLRSLVLVGALFSSHGVFAQESVALKLRVVDAETKKPIACRAYLRDSAGEWATFESDSPDGTALPFRRKTNDVSFEFHTTLSAHGATAKAAPGKAKLRVVRGKEYLPYEETIELAVGKVEKVVALKRWIDMPKLGWRSGDTHSHRPLGEMANLVVAEDLHVGFPLSHWTTVAESGPITGNRVTPKVDGTPAKAIAVDADHLLWPLNTEYELFSIGGKNHTLGAVLLIGQSKVDDTTTPPVVPVAEKAHADGALLDLEKHSWPWSVVVAPTMKIDLFELANNHVWEVPFAHKAWTIEQVGEYMKLERDASGGLTEWGWIDFGFKTWYALRNCGLDIMPSAGTGAGVHPVPLGFGRVYVQTGDDFTYENWIKGLKEGRSFVTTGPMLFAKVGGASPGKTFRLDEPSITMLTGEVRSLDPIEKIELVQDGEVVETLKPETRRDNNGVHLAEFDMKVSAERTGWFAVRTFARAPNGGLRFAHTAPWKVEVKGTQLQPTTAEIDYLIGRVETEIQRCRPVLPPEALKEFEAALAFYREVKERGTRK